tara:strand:- start:1979 stop:2173 length:195 start_codon:yes stop_codon:yes gene_type:complete
LDRKKKNLGITRHGNAIDSYGFRGFVIKAIGIALSGAILPTLDSSWSSNTAIKFDEKNINLKTN